MTKTKINNNLPVYFLKMGNIHITDQEKLIMTVLGSCISVTMFSWKPRLAAISHSQLPTCDKYDKMCSECPRSQNYVECSIDNMKQKFIDSGIPLEQVEVKIFGGGNVIKSNGFETVGAKNIRIAIERLEKENIQIISKDLGGEVGRKIFFSTKTGEVFVKRLDGLSEK